jgi:hypothetical protein
MISTCPKCQEQVSIPFGVEAEAMVRCPMCDAEYALGEALALAPPELIVVSPAARTNRPIEDAARVPSASEAKANESAEAAAAVAMPADEPLFADEPAEADWTGQEPASGEESPDRCEEENEATAAAGPGSPLPSAALRRQRRAPSGLRRLVETLVGAVVGLVIAYYALAICLGPKRFQEDVIERFGLPQLPLPFISAPTERPSKSPAKEPDHTATETHPSPSN